MRNIKIGIAILVVTAIAIFMVRSFIFPPPPPLPPAAQNQYIKKVENEINILKLKPENVFCKNHYDLVEFYIKDYHKNKKFSVVASENDQLKEDLSKQLFAAYTDKFIKQSYYVFARAEWRDADLSLIRSEVMRLKNSPYLSNPSPVYTSFNQIQSILKKHDEIETLIDFCKGYSYKGSDGLSDRFPISVAQNNISKAKTYLANNLDNQYVNNCARLRQELKEVSNYFFRAHVKYLDNKITNWSGMYVNYKSQKAYRDGLYLPLKTELDDLKIDIYDAVQADLEYKRLLKRWQIDAVNASEHFP